MKMHTKIIKPGAVGLISFAALASVMLFVDPTNKSVVYILIPVLLVWVTSFCVLQVAGLILFKSQHALYTIFSMVITSAGVLLMLLSGLGQLTLRDMVLTVLLTAIASFYVYRTWSKE